MIALALVSSICAALNADGLNERTKSSQLWESIHRIGVGVVRGDVAGAATIDAMSAMPAPIVEMAPPDPASNRAGLLPITFGES